MEEGSVCETDQVQSPIDVKHHTTISGPTRGATSVLEGKRLKFNWDEQSRVDEARRKSAVRCGVCKGGVLYDRYKDYSLSISIQPYIHQSHLDQGEGE